MKAKILDQSGERTIALVFDIGDEVVATLTRFASEHNIGAARLTGIGAFSHATLGFFDWRRRDYKRIAIDEQVEVLALVGDIARDEAGAPKLHAHVVLGKEDASAQGGHLLEAYVRPTLEVVLTESPAQLERRHDPVSGLALIRID